MQENLKVFRLGPNFRIEQEKIYQLFFVPIGKPIIEASHIGLNRGTIFAATAGPLADFRSSRNSYKKIPTGFKYVYFFGHCDKKAGFNYDNLVWVEELKKGDSRIFLVRGKAIPI